MTDPRQRQLHRRARGGDVDAGRELARSLVRSGRASGQRAEFAQWLLDTPSSDNLSDWRRALVRWQQAAVRGAVALCRVQLPLWEQHHPDDRSQRAIVVAMEQWLDHPSEAHSQGVFREAFGEAATKARRRRKNRLKEARIETFRELRRANRVANLVLESANLLAVERKRRGRPIYLEAWCRRAFAAARDSGLDDDAIRRAISAALVAWVCDDRYDPTAARARATKSAISANSSA